MADATAFYFDFRKVNPLLSFSLSRSFCCWRRSYSRFSLCSHVDDCACWTILCTKSAVLALFRIDESKVVFNCDRFKLTSLFALLASDTTVGASFSCLSTCILGVARNNNLVLCRSNSDNLVRALVSTHTAAYAEFSCYYSYAVANLDCAVRTDSFAVAKAKTAVNTASAAAI